jgi:hypothetical protein
MEGNLHGSQVMETGKLLIKPTASPTVDTTIHLMLDQRAEVLVAIGPFFPQVAPDPMTPGNRQILKQTVPTFITDRAVMGMVHHQPFNHVFTEIDRFLVSRRYDHALLPIRHAAHLHPFDRAFKKLHRAHATGTNRSKGWMEAEPRDDDAQSGSSLDHLRPFRNFYFQSVDLQLRHSFFLGKMSNLKVQRSIEFQRTKLKI